MGVSPLLAPIENTSGDNALGGSSYLKHVISINFFLMIDNQNKLLMLWEPYLCIKSLLGRIEGTWIVVAMCAHMNVQISYKYKAYYNASQNMHN